jgi:hypothetical protein
VAVAVVLIQGQLELVVVAVQAGLKQQHLFL